MKQIARGATLEGLDKYNRKMLRDIDMIGTMIWVSGL